jgi:hypothetical protein
MHLTKDEVTIARSGQRNIFRAREINNELKRTPVA